MSFNGAASTLRQTLEQGKDIVIAPGVYDGFSARIAHQVGFSCLYMVSVKLPPLALILTSLPDRCRNHSFPPGTRRPGYRDSARHGRAQLDDCLAEA